MRRLLERQQAILFLAMLLGMLVLPAENRAFLFHVTPADFYGEYVLATDAVAVVLAKNSGSATIQVPLPQTGIALVETRSGVVGVRVLAGIPPQGLAMAAVSGELAQPRVVDSPGGPFAPRPLAVMTRADQRLLFGYVIGLGIGALVLGLLLSQFAVERAPQPRDTG